MGETIEFPGAGAETPRRSKPLWRHVLGAVLRDERLEQQRILTEVARTAGVSPQYLSEVERGRKEASSEVLGAVTDALGLELGDVVGRVAGRLAFRGSRELREIEVARHRVAVDAPTAAPWGGAPAPTSAYLLAA
jgi:transcriptional regulator with XRE-family HTH domain